MANLDDLSYPPPDYHRSRRWRALRRLAARPGRVVSALAAVVLLAGAGAWATGQLTGATPAASTAAPLPPLSVAGFPSGDHEPGIFTDRCGYSHSATDDPILAPGRPGVSMHHDFYGNTTTTASSTAAHLVGGPTTCTTTADSSAYWTPVMYQNGKALTPNTALIYWRKPAGDQASVATFPAGLQVIAGDETATAPQPLDVVAWSCTGAGATHRTATPHSCPGREQLRVTVTFPSCWDGHTLTGAGQTDVVYRSSAGCPASHPIQIPQVVFHVSWPTSDATGLSLSMGPAMQGSTDTMHVDLVNGWNQPVLDRDVAGCVATATRCGPVSGPLADPHGPATRRPGRGR